MKLKRLSLVNCGGFEQIDIDFESDITLIAGVNGVGKSTLLQALAVVLSRAMPALTPSRSAALYFTDDKIYGDKNSLGASVRLEIDGQIYIANVKRLRNAQKHGDRFSLILGPDTVTVEATDFTELLSGRTLTGEVEAGEKETPTALTERKRDANPPLAIYFTPKRQLPGQPRKLPPDAKPFDPSMAFSRALHDREVELREFMHWFRTQEKLGAGSDPRRLKVLDTLRSVVNQLVPEFSNLRIQESPRLGFMVEKGGNPFYLHQLSDGERSLLAVVLDLTRRLAIANPESEDPIAEGVALVLIDEIELHLHPKWQRDVIKRLPKIFRTCQFIITTHSPQVIGEVQARCVRILSTKEGRVISETPGMAYGVDSNWILNVLMDADEMSKDVETALENIARLIADRKLVDARKQTDQLRNCVGNIEAIQKMVSTIERIERLGK